MASKKTNRPKSFDNQALRTFRTNVAKLKKKGVVSKRVDARKQAPTRYMRAKVRKFQDVLSGQSIAVKAKKSIREKYTTAGIFEERGSFLIVPKENARSRARIKKGRDLIEIITPLKFGEEREVVLPFKATDMLDLAQKIQDNKSVDDLKKGDEQFAFRLFGHNSRKGFVDREEFADHVLRNYRHLFSGRNGATAIKHLSVIRFKGYADQVPAADPNSPYFEEPIFDKPRRDSKPKVIGTYERQILKKRAAKKRKTRANETPERRAKRLADQRKRTARNKAMKKGK